MVELYWRLNCSQTWIPRLVLFLHNSIPCTFIYIVTNTLNCSYGDDDAIVIIIIIIIIIVFVVIVVFDVVLMFTWYILNI